MEKSKKTESRSPYRKTGRWGSLTLGQLLDWAFPILAVVAGLLYVIPMQGVAGGVAFPFDDAYTALTYARNLVDFGAYSSHATDGVTSGPIAPLQVFLVALIGLVTGVMRASLLLGIASFAALVVLTSALGLRMFRERRGVAIAAALLMALSPRMAGAAASGLPTLLLIALLLASAYFYFARRPMLFFLFAGLALWTHPVALVFMVAAIIHLLYNHIAVKKEFRPVMEEGQAVSGKQTAIGGVIYLLLVAGYGVFNYALSGTFFPNPVAAKLAYFAGAGTDYLEQVWRFFTREGWGVALPFATLGLVFIVVDVVRRRPLPVLMGAVFVVGLLLAYGLLFPVVMDHHTLLPVLPFFAMLSFWGLARSLEFLTYALPFPFMPRLGGVLFLLIAVATWMLTLTEHPAYRRAHLRTVQYVLERDVAAAKWIGMNTPANVRVATHLPGVVTYYGARAVFDITGKLSPELRPIMGDMAKLVARLRKSGVHVVAARRDQLEVVNTNPVFTSDPRLPDVMEVFFYAPGRTHLMSQAASALNMEASRLMSLGRWRDAVPVLQASFKEDPYSSRTSTLYGLTLLQLGDTANARTYLSQALTLHGEYAPAMVPLADVMVRQKEFDQAIRMLKQALEVNPASVQAEASLREAREAKRKDSLRAAGVQTITITR
ncbi:MAG: tetratricopeptide repeat protein [Bacteroidetes bacterium]|nr:tetratricopeptide repeat protein [Bacteroidota bacterium]